MKAALFSNPLSRYNRVHAGLVSACAKPLGLAEYMLDTEALNNLTLLDEMLDRHAQAGGDTLIVNGGDGTLDLIIARLREARFTTWQPEIILLRSGTTSMTHRDVGYGRDPAVALARAMRRDTAWTKTTRDLLRLSGENIPTPQYGFFFGTHALVRAIRHARHTLHTRGMHGALGEALLFTSTLGALLRGKAHGHPILDPTTLSYTRHAAQHSAEHIFLIASTLKTLVLGMRAAQPAAGEFGCISIITPTDGLWRQVPSLWRGAPEQSAGPILRWCDSALTLSLNSEVTLDGELFSATKEAPLTLAIDSPVT
jgi:diacylglycerol kinase (ATP)